MKTNVNKTRRAALWIVPVSIKIKLQLITVAIVTICSLPSSSADNQSQDTLRKSSSTGTIVGRVFAFQNQSLTPEVRVESFELFIRGDRFKSATAKVDEDGRFVFNNVPCGRVRLQPTFSADDVHGVMLSSSLTFSTTVVSGQTREITLFGKGRPVTGQIRVPPGIDARKLRIELVLVAPPVRAILGPSGNKPTPLAHVYERVRKEAGDLSSSLDEHGRFRIEGVREGAYWINVTNLSFANKETPEYPSIENSKLRIDLMASGESHSPLELGALVFRRPVRAAELAER